MVRTILTDQLSQSVERGPRAHQENTARKLVGLDVVLPQVHGKFLALFARDVGHGRRVLDVLFVVVRVVLVVDRDVLGYVDVDDAKPVRDGPSDVRLRAVNLLKW